MHESQMCQMPSNVEHQHTKQNSKGRVHMPLLHVKKRAIKKAVAKAVLFLVKVGISLFAAWLISLWAIPAAYAERGYSAVGGEWMLILSAGALTFWAVTRWLDIRIKKWRRRSRNAVQNLP
ncbi:MULTISPECIES: hypothetical protein [unclassified Dehalobacter]|uniref:hypothetical protein n=1 Tax=unclassified Dehalobacter TaxID=2635733 RepID=UPI00104ED87F|nr:MULTISPECIES: hypothetical protein [unclassified Dehalobacter]TCX51977.1 hypothetical protein C1I36_06565 [Dehalobacter sp. 14DCB1]TCX53037.1 hypothetical protein C1I38_08245 [Dehalobacter sp. 12DCB1]